MQGNLMLMLMGTILILLPVWCCIMALFTVLLRVAYPSRLNSYAQGVLTCTRCSAASRLCYPSTTAALELSSLINICCLELVSSSLLLQQDCCLLA